MDADDNLPLRGNDPLANLIREDLDPLSINELDARITLLKNEIKRCEDKKIAAANHMSAADSLFKKT